MRKETVVVIETAGRDAGKHFKIREMSARRAESWATRALLALTRSGVEVPDDLAGAGMAGIAAVSLRALGGLSYTDLQPLMDEMLECVTIIPDPSKPAAFDRKLVEDDVEEVATLVRLREEVLSLHLGFSIAAYRLKLAEAVTKSLPPAQTT